jgi:CRP-like cAMP-binding protein
VQERFNGARAAARRAPLRRPEPASMSPTPFTHALADSYLCRYLGGEEVERLEQAGTIREVSRGERLFAEGDQGGCLFVILNGQVKITKRGKDARERPLAALQPGEMIGEMSVIDTEPRSATATTLTPTVVFELSRRQMMDFVKAQPDLASKILWAILETVSLRLRASNQSYQELLGRMPAPPPGGERS